MTVYVATKNAGKLLELRAIFGAHGWTLETFAGYAEVEESAGSYAGNAALKARALRAQLLRDGIDGAALGDDSGLEVEALGGRPGVYSARFGGAGVTWPERRRLLLADLAGTGDTARGARFVCALHFIAPGGRETAVESFLEGTIAPEERGVGGFSYDPLFLFEPRGLTFAELSAEEKNEVSHRARAAGALLAALRDAAAADGKPSHAGT